MSLGRLTPAPLAIGLALGLAHGAPLAAQPQPSQHGSVSQVVNTTTIRVEYDRPVLRGRSLFGDILDYDAVWTPGANRATWVEFSAPVFLEGHPLPAGRYGVWMVPHESAPWEVVFVTQWDTHHSFFPSDEELLRVEVSSEASPPTETLTFDFPEVDSYEATLRFHWGEVAVPIQILVAH